MGIDGSGSREEALAGSRGPGQCPPDRKRRYSTSCPGLGPGARVPTWCPAVGAQAPGAVLRLMQVAAPKA